MVNSKTDHLIEMSMKSISQTGQACAVSELMAVDQWCRREK
jgi:hypothetical protein